MKTIYQYFCLSDYSALFSWMRDNLTYTREDRNHANEIDFAWIKVHELIAFTEYNKHIVNDRFFHTISEHFKDVS